VGLPIDDMKELYCGVKSKLEQFLEMELTTKEIEHNSTRNRYVGYRVVRPQREDYNPFHRDSWIDYWQDTINFWLPLSGFNNENGLQIVAQSHKFKNEDIYRTKSGYMSGDKTYHVPATIAFNHPFKILKPKLSKGQGLLFTPFLIHGNGVNNSSNETRVSLEFRFSKK
jgi:ectoine hydroxylase-related dioxygenase (phytanoyl-CoA dioxygenase family)